jgi:hypothetical protein
MRHYKWFPGSLGLIGNRTTLFYYYMGSFWDEKENVKEMLSVG